MLGQLYAGVNITIVVGVCQYYLPALYASAILLT